MKVRKMFVKLERLFYYMKSKNRNGLNRLNTYKSPLYDEDGEMMGTVE